MWIFTTKGFVSAIYSNGNIIIRSRNKQHLKNLFPNEDILETGKDYPYRITIPKNKFIETMSKEMENINYHNFKDTVSDPFYHQFLTNIWIQGLNYEDTLNVKNKSIYNK